VRPDRRGLGIGGAFMVEMMDVASGRGCPTASLYVRADNPAAHALYERIGFRDVDRLPAYYRPSETDAVIMEADLRSAPR
jgi:ribosomal-protein-alanine N-acetyltransferase